MFLPVMKTPVVSTLNNSPHLSCHVVLNLFKFLNCSNNNKSLGTRSWVYKGCEDNGMLFHKKCVYAVSRGIFIEQNIKDLSLLPRAMSAHGVVTGLFCRIKSSHSVLHG